VPPRVLRGGCVQHFSRRRGGRTHRGRGNDLQARSWGMRWVSASSTSTHRCSLPGSTTS